MTMSWNEFKQMVDAALVEAGAENPEIHYIDISFPVATSANNPHGHKVPSVFVGNLGLQVSA